MKKVDLYELSKFSNLEDKAIINDVFNTCVKCGKCAMGFELGDDCLLRNNTIIKDSAKLDSILEELWEELEDISFDVEKDCINVDWYIFKAKTNKEYIWHWFDNLHSKGVSFLLYYIDCNK